MSGFAEDEFYGYRCVLAVRWNEGMPYICVLKTYLMQEYTMM